MIDELMALYKSGMMGATDAGDREGSQAVNDVIMTNQSLDKEAGEAVAMINDLVEGDEAIMVKGLDENLGIPIEHEEMNLNYSLFSREEDMFPNQDDSSIWNFG